MTIKKKSHNYIIGKKGEDIAIELLKAKGYKIIQQNFHAQWGEIDIIAKSPTEEYYILVEVKTRTNNNFGSGVDAVTKYKIEKIIRTATAFFLDKLDLHEIPYFQIDIISVFFNYTQTPKCEHLTNIGLEDY